MNIIIVYESQTGTTKKAAVSMAETFKNKGHRCQLLSISDARPDLLMRSDLVCIGGWVRGWFIIRQRPSAGIMNFISKIENLTGRDAVVFCTYKLSAGSTLRKLAEGLEGTGARVVAMFKFRGSEPDDKFAAFVDSLR